MKMYEDRDIRYDHGENEDIFLEDFSFDTEQEDEDLNVGDDVDLTTLLD